MSSRNRSYFRTLRAAALSALSLHGAACAPQPDTHAAAAGNKFSGAPSNARTPAPTPVNAAAPSAKRARPKVIVFVWDGLRPDSVDPRNTPNLARMRDQEGVNCSDHHAVYPTFTMMNAAAFATGAYPAQHGFYGNTEYQPGPVGNNAEGKAIDFSQPVFTEDHGVLQALDSYYRAHGARGLFQVDTLFQTAHAAGLRTAAVGKIGPAFLQDYRPDEHLSVLLDENIALPLSFARGLQAESFALPVNAPRYPFGGGQTLSLLPDNGKPSAPNSERLIRLADGVTPDPRSALGSAHDAANEYLMGAYLDYVLPRFDPDLSVLWLRNPDSTEHQFGPGAPNYVDALRDQDQLLGKLEAKLVQLGLRSSTDVFVVSDHGHSTVAGDPALFPLRALRGEPDGHGEVSTVDASGYAVSGEVRTADLLTRAGFAHVYDGGGCLLDPVLSGIRADGSLVYPTRTDTKGGCVPVSPTGKPVTPAPHAPAKPAAQPYSLPGFRVPSELPKDAIVVAANGGSEYFYVVDHAQKSVEHLVRALQERSAYGAIFVRSAYGSIAGTLPLSSIHAEGEQSSPPTPDLIVSFAWDEDARASGSTGLPGTEYASAQRYRGMHGSFSSRDVHNTLIAAGPHLKVGFSDALPTGNVDLAPTVATLLGLHFDAPSGRVLQEALLGQSTEYHVESVTQRSPPVLVRRFCRADDPSCKHATGALTYALTLQQKVLSTETTKYTYFDHATVTRQSQSQSQSH